MKICIKAWAWVGIEDRIGIGPGSNYNEGPKLGIGPGSMFRAPDRIEIEILGIDPSLAKMFIWYETLYLEKVLSCKYCFY